MGADIQGGQVVGVRKVYISPKMRKWKGAFESPNCPYPFSFDVKSEGFLEYYITLKDFKKDNPGLVPIVFRIEG